MSKHKQTTTWATHRGGDYIQISELPSDRLIAMLEYPDDEDEANFKKMAAVNHMVAALQRCIAALAANGAPNCEAVKEAKAALEKGGVQ